MIAYASDRSMIWSCMHTTKNTEIKVAEVILIIYKLDILSYSVPYMTDNADECISQTTSVQTYIDILKLSLDISE